MNVTCPACKYAQEQRGFFSIKPLMAEIKSMDYGYTRKPLIACPNCGVVFLTPGRENATKHLDSIEG